MKLDYATLISPYPYYIEGIGNVKCPTLKEIWNPEITYQGYSTFLTLLLLTPQTYLEQVNPSQNFSLPDANITMFDLIANDKTLQEQYCVVFSFFLEEDVSWDNTYGFITYMTIDDSNEPSIKGVINKDLFNIVCDIILQRCDVNRKDSDVDTSKVENKRALEILKKIQKNRKSVLHNSAHDKDMDLPNLIASVAVKSNSINYTNIWDLTVFQLYEHFRREQNNVYFNIQQMSVAAWGDTKRTFKGNEWFKNNN